MKWGSIGSTTGSRDDFKGLIYADERWALVIESCRHYNLILPGPRCRAGGPFRNHQLCSSLGSEAHWTRHIIPLAARQITFKGWILRSCYSTARLEPGSHLQSLWFIVEAEIVRGTTFIVWRTNSSTHCRWPWFQLCWDMSYFPSECTILHLDKIQVIIRTI